MIHILIVDDEKAARSQIEYELRSGYPEEIMVESVSNGFAALELAEQNKPDILLADIKMPKMDGITLTQKMKEKNPDIKVILITGYADKEIVKQAIRMGVDNFIEKPIVANELISAVVKAREAISRSARVSELNSSRVVFALAKAGCDVERLFSNQSYYFYKKMLHMRFQTVILKILPVDEVSPVNQPDILSSLFDLLHEWSMEALYAFKTENILMIHFCMEKETDFLRTEAFCENYMTGKEEYFFFCCMGKVVGCMQEIYLSYNEAILCMEQSFFRRRPGICRIQEMTDNGAEEMDNPEKLQSLLREDKKSEVFELLDQIHRHLQSCSNKLIIDAKKIYIDFVHQLFVFSAEYCRNFSKEHREQDVILQINSVQWLEQLHQMVYRLLKELLSDVENRDKESALVSKVETYVKSHITDSNLSLDRIADYCALSSGYVNRIFKKKTGQTLNEYIGNVRIKKALTLLMETNDTMEHIALCVGYGSANYFYSVFKKKYGVTPAEYRNMYVGGGKA